MQRGAAECVLQVLDTVICTVVCRDFMLPTAFALETPV